MSAQEFLWEPGERDATITVSITEGAVQSGEPVLRIRMDPLGVVSDATFDIPRADPAIRPTEFSLTVREVPEGPAGFSFAAPTAEVNEGDTFTFDVTVAPPLSDPSSVRVRSVGGTGVEGFDYELSLIHI